MGKQVREVQYFFSSQNFSDGLRVTFGIILPSLVLAQLGQLELGVIVSIGAFCVSITDIPGPPVHRRNGMLFCCLCIFVVAFVTGFARMHMLLMGLEILLFSFFFSMLAVYGNRAAVVGTAALLVMILLMDEPQRAAEVPVFSALVLGGGLWYTVLSLLLNQLMPHRPVQQALGECIREVARFLALKGQFYRAETDLDETFQKLVAQQILVNEKQEAVREVLFKNRLLVKESTNTSRRQLLIFVELVDLFERSMLIHYDYAILRQKFGKSGVLEAIAETIESLAAALDSVGLAMQLNTPHRAVQALNAQLEGLKEAIDRLSEGQTEDSTLPLKKVLINLRDIAQRLTSIQLYPGRKRVAPAEISGLDYSRFVSHKTLDFKTFADNLSLRSAIYRHALRVAIGCVLGYAITTLYASGEHGYWVLLTIIVILKPAFSLTKQRNYQRLIGTLAGGFLGFALLYFIQDQGVLFALLVFLMVGAFSFLRVNYVVFVLLLTPLVLILFSFLGEDNMGLLQERIIDTLIGSAIAFAASYLLFPSWESEQLQRHMQAVVLANTIFLQKLTDRLQGRAVPTAEYKLARKDVYVSAANVSAAFQRMLSEPRSKQNNSKELHKFVVLNHILSANIATVAAALNQRQQALGASAERVRVIRRALNILDQTLKKMGAVQQYAPQEFPQELEQEEHLSDTGMIGRAREERRLDDPLLDEQLQLIERISSDIRKTTVTLLS